ncbi:MAG: hypothetical protein KR126chlam1_01429 [Chlamydiae bacterium]|nr:hypothetical protein [Chlamydiota bacterium]
MELTQQCKFALWREGGEKHHLTTAQLEDKLGFTCLSELSFQSPDLKTHLLQEGKKRAETKEIDPLHLELGDKWQNQIEEGTLPSVSIRWIDQQVEYGLFAEETLEVGTFAGEYVGLVRKNNDHLSLSNYLYAYPICDEIGRNYVIDAAAGSLIRFINHSYKPNLAPHYAFVDGLYHMILLVIAPIKKGEQLTYNYGKNYWYVRSPPKEFS